MGLMKPQLQPGDTNLLIHPPIPPPLWGTCPRNIMGGKKWKLVSLEVREVGICAACGTTHAKKYEAHEVYKYNLHLYRQRLDKIVCVCWMCHQFIHYHHNQDAGRKLSEELSIAIWDHGNMLLHRDNDSFDVWRSTYTQWDDRWHLRWNCKSYYSDFTEPQWREYYNIT
ncbi:MAG: hypothetical protein KAS32_14515 [Candidatus Peribacteraceae bacterium]|nr:hypothetical protein [Candidatus Peribacteraceae bacterium]